MPPGGPDGGGELGGGEPGGLPVVAVVILKVSDTLFTVTVQLTVVPWLEEDVIFTVKVSPAVTVALPVWKLPLFILNCAEESPVSVRVPPVKPAPVSVIAE